MCNVDGVVCILLYCITHNKLNRTFSPAVINYHQPLLPVDVATNYHDGPWGNMAVLAQKPHQEHVRCINDFVWQICVSYCKLSSITKLFQFPIPRCDDAVMILGWGAGEIWIIPLDAR